MKWDGNCSSLKRPFTELSFPIKCPGSIQKNKIDRHKASKLKLYALLALLQRSYCEIKVRISWVPLRNSSPSETSVSLYKAHGFVGLMEKIPLFINFPFSFKPTSYLTLLSSALSTHLSDDISSLFPPALQSTTFFSIQNCNPLLVLYFLDNYICVFFFLCQLTSRFFFKFTKIHNTKSSNTKSLLLSCMSNSFTRISCDKLYTVILFFLK